jgi:hypothetical protein
MSCLEQVFAHGLAHDAESDESDFHVVLFFWNECFGLPNWKEKSEVTL